MLKTVNTPVGPVSLHIQSDEWKCELRNSNPLPGLTLVSMELQRDTPAALPPATLSWLVPAIDIQYRWHPFAGTTGCWLPPTGISPCFTANSPSAHLSSVSAATAAPTG